MAPTPQSYADSAAPGPKSGPLPAPFAGWPARALAVPYAVAIARRNRRFDAGTGVVHLDRPVVSVGNLSVGGTGKTPMVAHLARILLQAGHRPCIAMRGYGAKPGQDSDEAAVYRRVLPDVPVVARPDRLAGLLELFASPEGEQVDVVLLDDGFQHRRIARDLDLVLIDATRSPFIDRLLPAGWLREPVTGLHRATGVMITHAEAVEPARVAELARRVAEVGTRVVGVCRHAWAGLSIRENGVDRSEKVPWLRGRRPFAVCAIGNPHAFMRAVAAATGAAAVDAQILRDHDPYGPGTIASIRRRLADTRADVLLTTEKDWSKLSRHDWPVPVARPNLEMRFDSGGEALKQLVLERTAAAGDPPSGPDRDAPDAPAPR